jgi:hypothetical protein
MNQLKGSKELFNMFNLKKSINNQWSGINQGIPIISSKNE